MRKLATILIAASAALLLGAGVANADITSQSTSESDHMAKSSEGTSNAAEDHMANNGPGIVRGEGTKRVLDIVGYKPVFDEEGNQVFEDDGETPVLQAVWGWVPIGSGVAPATIVHNP